MFSTSSFLIIAFTCLWVASGEIYFMEDIPHVKIKSNEGIVSGAVLFSRDDRPYNSFTGIPYAKIPTRFQESKLIEKEEVWDGIFDATKKGPRCVQTQQKDIKQIQLGSTPGGKMLGKEDCLNLNVFVPWSSTETDNPGYPVIVWVHDGDFAASKLYNPQYFMDEDVILVTINYRLGLFGFLSTGDNVIPGNLGLKDMVVALRWVQENIGGFGGDSGRVTITGFEAGGAAVHHLLLSPTAKGLFHRAISQSGTALGLQYFDLQSPRKAAVDLATSLNCPKEAEKPEEITSEEILTCLEGLSTKEIMKGQQGRNDLSQLGMKLPFLPTLEPSDPISSLTPFLTKPPTSITTNLDDDEASGEKIPWMVGATVDESAKIFELIQEMDTSLIDVLDSRWEMAAPVILGYGTYLSKKEGKKVSKKIKPFYFGEEDISKETMGLFSELVTDHIALHIVFRAAMEMASKGTPVYFYQYAYQDHQYGNGSKKPGKGSDILQLFDDKNGKGNKSLEEPDVEFSRNFVRLWTSFATFGEPTHVWGDAEDKKWLPISHEEVNGYARLKWYRIDSNPAHVNIEKNVMDRMEFWNKLWEDHFIPGIEKKGEEKNKAAEVKTEL